MACTDWHNSADCFAYGCYWMLETCQSSIQVDYDLYTGTGINTSTSPWSIVNPTRQINLVNYPPNTECFYALVNLYNLYNTSPIDVNFTFRKYSTYDILWQGSVTIPTPVSQGYDYWSWYSVEGHIGHFLWEINEPGLYAASICLTGDEAGCESTSMNVTYTGNNIVGSIHNSSIFYTGPFQGGTNQKVASVYAQNIGSWFGFIRIKAYEYPNTGNQALIYSNQALLEAGQIGSTPFPIWADIPNNPGGTYPVGVKVWGDGEGEPAWGTTATAIANLNIKKF